MYTYMCVSFSSSRAPYAPRFTSSRPGIKSSSITRAVSIYDTHRHNWRSVGQAEASLVYTHTYSRGGKRNSRRASLFINGSRRRRDFINFIDRRARAFSPSAISPRALHTRADGNILRMKTATGGGEVLARERREQGEDLRAREAWISRVDVLFTPRG